MSTIEYIPYKEVYGEGFEDMQRRVPSLTKLEAATGFRPRTPLETIIEDIQRERLEAELGNVDAAPRDADRKRA